MHSSCSWIELEYFESRRIIDPISNERIKIHLIYSETQKTWPFLCQTTVKCHYNACHYNVNASLTRSLVPKPRPHAHPRLGPSGSAHGQKVWNHRGLIGNDTPLFPYKWNKTKVSHLLVMSIQSIRDWSSIKHPDYSSPLLRECHHQANMAARRPDVENNPGSNQVNIGHAHEN